MRPTRYTAPIPVRLAAEDRDAVTAIAQREQIQASQVIRRAVRREIERNAKQEEGR